MLKWSNLSIWKKTMINRLRNLIEKVDNMQEKTGHVTKMALLVKHLPVNAWDMRDAGSVPGLGRSPGRRHGNPLQYSCLENPMDRGAWQAIVHRVVKNQTWLKWLNTQSGCLYNIVDTKCHWIVHFKVIYLVTCILPQLKKNLIPDF